MENSLIIFLLPILTAIIGSYLTYYFTNKSKRNEAILKFKEEKYSNLLILLQGFVGKTTSGEIKKRFFEEQYKSWLYSSDGVVSFLKRYYQLVIESKGKDPNPKKGRETVGNIVLEMRNDLLGKTRLSGDDFRYTDVIK